MKINYHTEDYKASLITLIILILLIIFIIFWAIPLLIYGDLSNLVFVLIVLSLPLILGIFIFKRYKKQKYQRNMNLYIINNGICIEGVVTSIKNICVYGPEMGRGIHNTVADVTFTYNDIKQTLTVDQLNIREKDIKKYKNKKVKIYIYNNMNYVDIIN